MKKLIFCTILLISFISSCSKKQDDKKAIARVYDAYLYEEDLKEILPENYSKEDSVLLVSNYINSWAQDQLLLKKAEINLDDKASVDKLVDQYREDLLINKYKSAVVEQYLDTVVTSDDISKFYNENKEIFKLNEELVKLKYIYFSNDLLNPNDFVTLFKSSKKVDADSLKSQEMQLNSFNLNDSIWIRLEDIMAKIPSFDNRDKERILKKSKYFEKKDSLGVYLVAVKEALKRNETAPMSYVLPTIKQMILHKKKLELLKKIEETLVEDALSSKEFEIYESSSNN